ncbi:hypothetical protein [Bacterioplanoides sp.]|uniref:hypothetical protein n=1 Tax=Bacterioplanoides sp. TaxID=2066072 RepID=UPI003AFFB68A
MIITKIPAAGLVALLTLNVTLARSAQLIQENQTVIGSACIGLDCFNGEDFSRNNGDQALSNDVLRLKENNLRINFDDASAAEKLGKRWEMTFNSTANGGGSYFLLQALNNEKSEIRVSDGYQRQPICDGYGSIFDGGYIENEFIPAGEPILVPASTTVPQQGYLVECETSDVLSDGTVPAPICDVVQNNDTVQFNGVIPNGEPIIEVASVTQGFWTMYTCTESEELDYQRQNLFQINAGANGDIVLGEGGPSSDERIVSLGRDGMVRQLKNIASAFSASDIVTVGDLKQALENTDQQLDVIDLFLASYPVFKDFLAGTSDQAPTPEPEPAPGAEDGADTQSSGSDGEPMIGSLNWGFMILLSGLLVIRRRFNG